MSSAATCRWLTGIPPTAHSCSTCASLSSWLVESAPGAVNIPLGQLRARLGELPRDREILVICRSGQRAYYATRILLQHGFQARNLSGGFLSRAIQSENFIEAPALRATCG